MRGGVLAWFIFVFTIFLVAYANDPNPLQDFCVANTDPNTKVRVNGFVCKNPNEVTSEEFTYRGLNIPMNTNNSQGVGAKLLTPSTLPGLNTLGVSFSRVDYAASGGMTTPHAHPRATEVITVIEGSLYTGFVSGANKLYSKVLTSGDVFVYPQGLVHFAYNVGTTKAVSYAAFSSENPGNSKIVNVIFGTDPPISVDILSKAFQLDSKIVEDLLSKFPI